MVVCSSVCKREIECKRERKKSTESGERDSVRACVCVEEEHTYCKAHKVSRTPKQLSSSSKTAGDGAEGDNTTS